jgi:hypothetical protein
MKKLLLLVAGLLLPVVASAQTFDPNLIFTAGATARLGTLLPAEHRFQVVVTAGLPGIKITDSFLGGTLYTLGPGLNVQTVDLAAGTTTGLAADLSGLTFHPGGGQFVIQAAVARDLIGDNKRTQVLVTVGGGVTSPKAIAAKRQAKADADRQKLIEEILKATQKP